MVGASSEELALATSIVLMWTVFFTVVQPMVAIAAGLDNVVAGAWLGASIDQTGNVVGAAEMVSPVSAEVAAVTKIILNSGLGFLCVALFFCTRSWNETEGESTNKQSYLRMIWDKFPKFIVGYLAVCLILTAMWPSISDTAVGYALPRALKALSDWWFCLGFVGLGLNTAFRASTGRRHLLKCMQSYLAVNIIDMLLALGFSLLCFKVLFPGAADSVKDFAHNDLLRVKLQHVHAPACALPEAVFTLHDAAFHSPYQHVFGDTDHPPYAGLPDCICSLYMMYVDI